MAEYIERESLMKAITEDMQPFTVAMVARHIREHSAAEVEPKRKPEYWIVGDYGCYCSGCYEDVPDYKRSKYCPNCGAPMMEG